MIKLIASDLDGTLLNEDHLTDERILSAIETVRQRGVIFSAATGRSLHTHEVNRLHLAKYYRISMNGALITDPEEKVIYRKAILPEIIEELLEEFRGIDFDLSGRKFTYSTISIEEKLEYFRTHGFKDVANNPLRIRDFFVDFRFNSGKEDILKEEIYKINCNVADPEIREQIASFIHARENMLVNAPSSPETFELTAQDVNKGNAVAYLASYLGVQEDETMVFGDSGNDLEMLKRFRNSYSMSNGTEEARKSAHYQIGSNSEYAVIAAMLKETEE